MKFSFIITAAVHPTNHLEKNQMSPPGYPSFSWASYYPKEQIRKGTGQS